MALSEYDSAAWERELQAHRLGYPDDRLVAMISRHFDGGDGKRALDAGFGSGRHLKLLLDQGFRTSGIEVIASAVREARGALGDHPNLESIRELDIAGLSSSDGTFDCIVAWGVAFLRPFPEMTGDLRKLASLLTSGGRLLANFRTPDSWFSGLGERLADSTFRLDQRAGPYEGMTYTFLERSDVERLMDAAGLRVIDFERVDLWKNDASQRHSWWIVAAEPLG